MADSVLDATVVAFSNGDLAGRRRGNALDTRLKLLEQVVEQRRPIRYNLKLRAEYIQHLLVNRNDIIALFVAALDSPIATFVPRNTLSRQLWAEAHACRWPAHDQHLLAAAIDGDQPTLIVTENLLANCGEGIRRRLQISVRKV